MFNFIKNIFSKRKTKIVSIDVLKPIHTYANEVFAYVFTGYDDFNELKKCEFNNLICHCKECKVNSIGFIEYAPLSKKDDCSHTNFHIGRCIVCGKVNAFPSENLELFFKYGSDEAINHFYKTYMK